ncbi:MAG: TolC family protein [Bacteroidia bacterium]|nr:TolC family protein [Bacteroidia bacterium]
MKKTLFFLFALICVNLSTAQSKNLEFFLHEGMKNSRLLMVVSSNAERNRLDSLLLKATTGFQVGALASGMFAPVINGFGYDAVKTDIYNLSAQVAVSKELTGTKKRRNQYAALDLQKKQSGIAGKISEQELKKNITGQYLVAYGYQQVLSFNDALQDQFDKEEHLLKALTQAGTYKQTDYLSFLVGQKQQSIQVEILRNQFNASFLTLCWLCGTADSAVCTLDDPQLKASLLPDYINSVFYHQFELDSLLLSTAKKQLDYDYQPKVNLYADAGYLSSLSVAPKKNFGASAGFSVSIPLYDGGQKKMQQSKFILDEQDRRHYAYFSQSQYKQALNSLWKQFRANLSISSKINEQIDLAKSLMEANHRLLETGDLRMAEYLYSIREYLAAKNQILQNTIEKYQIINELNYWNRTK